MPQGEVSRPDDLISFALSLLLPQVKLFISTLVLSLVRERCVNFFSVSSFMPVCSYPIPLTRIVVA